MKSRAKNLVLESINMHGDSICVDFFQRPDGTFGFEEFRRDFEDGLGWFPIGYYSGLVFGSLPLCRIEALKSVGWLESEIN